MIFGSFYEPAGDGLVVVTECSVNHPQPKCWIFNTSKGQRLVDKPDDNSAGYPDSYRREYSLNEHSEQHCTVKFPKSKEFTSLSKLYNCTNPS